MFIRYDPLALARESHDTDSKERFERDGAARQGSQREFLFFGDVESEWRKEGEEGYDAEGAKRAGDMCREIWREAAGSWDEGRLAGIFVSTTTALDALAPLVGRG